MNHGKLNAWCLTNLCVFYRYIKHKAWTIETVLCHLSDHWEAYEKRLDKEEKEIRFQFFKGLILS